jgi:transglutaminase-like putative cysteine protease
MDVMRLAAEHRAKRERFIMFLTVCIASLISLQILDLGLDKPILKLTLVAATTAGFVFSYFLEKRFYGLARIGVDLGGLLFVGAYVYKMIQDYSSIGNYLGMLAGIMLVLLSFITFEYRMQLQILLMGVVFIIFSATTSFDLLMVVYIPLFLIFASTGLYFANAIDLQQRVSYIGRDEALTPDQAAQFMYAVGGLIVRVVVVIIIVSVVVYTFVPHYTDINRPAFFLPQVSALDETVEDLTRKNNEGDVSLGAGGLSISGFSDSFDLANNRSVFGPSSLYFSDAVAMEVRSGLNGYMRGAAFDFYTGQGWEPRPEVAEHERTIHGRSNLFAFAQFYEVPVIDFPSRAYAKKQLNARGIHVFDNNVYSNNEDPSLNYDIVTQEVLFAKDHPPIFFSSYQPVKIEDISVVRTTEQQAYNPSPRVNDFSIVKSVLPRHPTRYSYKVTVLAPSVRRQQMTQVYSDPPAEIVQRYTQLPLDTNRAEMERIIGHPVVPVPYAVITKAQALVTGAETQKDKVQRIYDYLMNPAEFTYNTDIIPLAKDEEATDAFINRAKKGYCQQFASTMAVLCRAVKIPARVVTGYAPGSYSIIGNKYIYRDKNAHAWVEVYFDGLGWIAFDPTQSSSDVFSVNTVVEAVHSTTNFLENLFIVDPAGAKATILSFFVGVYNVLKPLVMENWWVAPTVLLIAGLIAFLIVLVRRRKPRAVPLYPQNQIIADYIELSKMFGVTSLGRSPSDTSKEFAFKLGEFFREGRGSLDEFMLLYEHAAFSPRRPSPDDVKIADDFIESVKKKLDESMHAGGKH